ncbi:hypothetical protein BD770DRAFT_323925 [Pilaira anomala]|nr:hypothetical protein BD770DRAFT_323925 [Pilaira anomala]
MLFYVDYTDENVKKCKKKLENFGNIEVCYNINPTDPVLVSIERIREKPQSYHLYSEKTN